MNKVKDKVEPEFSVIHSCAIEDASKDENEADDAANAEDVKLLYKPPRLFRKSLIYKTWKLFGTKIELEPKVNRPLKENLWWLSIMLVGFLFAFLITDKAWQKFQTNPTFTSLVLDQNKVKITFPTVSFCPESAADPQKVIEFIEKSGLIGNETKELEELLSAIPNFSYGASGLKSVVVTDAVRNHLQHLSITDPRAIAFSVASSCSDVLKSCKFKGKSIDCCDIFLPVFSEHGFCYSFNTRVYGTAHDEVTNSLFHIVDEFDDVNLSFELEAPGNVFLNPVDELLHFEQIPIKHAVVSKFYQAMITMQETKTDKNLEDLSIRQRNCILPNEMKLKYFKNEPYTISGCLKECKLERAMKVCGCVPPFYRSIDMMNATFCDIESLKCLKDEKIWELSKCHHCKLACEFKIFSVEYLKEHSIPEGSQEISQVTISLLEWPVLTYHREVRFGFVDFLVAFGSILALFLSFSLLSAIELLLYVLRFAASKLCPKQV